MESIWDEWCEHYKKSGVDESRICKDGIVRPEIFEKEKLKILFIGKEVNDWEGGDMRLLAQRGPRHSYLYNLGRWAIGLLENFPDFKQIDNKKSLNSALNRISLINLKKTSGGSTSNMTSISAYANNDKSLLLKQIKFIRPNIIVPLATHDVLIWLLGLEPNPEKPNKAPYFCPKNKAWVLPWKHPSMRGHARQAYEAFQMFMENNKDFIKEYNELKGMS
jgi:hypothetical protein